jgi:ABC-type branched-subunit amino acid transport system ATPase component
VINPPAILQCTDLTMRFGGVTALDNLSLSVAANEVLGLIGPNGSGKTTFFNVITGLYHAEAGSIVLAGQPAMRLSPQAIYHAGVSRTFQRSRLCLELSIFDNIVIGNHRNLRHGLWFNLLRRGALQREIAAQYDAVRELLALFDAPLADRVLDPVGGLSMIDRRRIEICRALIGRPQLLLLDEPSAGMTHEETTQLMADITAVRERLGNLTIVIIEHEMHVIERITDRCVVLNYGRAICQGTYAEIAADPLVREAYLGIE